MSEIKDGGPAFPVSTRSAGEPHEGAYGHQDDYDTWQFGGLTMRDYFAAKVMDQALCINPMECYMQGEGSLSGTEYLDSAAKVAYAIADAMIRARSQS
jgi:hypothetical protein